MTNSCNKKAENLRAVTTVISKIHTPNSTHNSSKHTNTAINSNK